MVFGSLKKIFNWKLNCTGEIYIKIIIVTLNPDEPEGIPDWQSLLTETRFGNPVNTRWSRRNERNRIQLYIFQFYTRDNKRGSNNFCHLSRAASSFRTLINYYAITSRPRARAPFSTQLPDNENIGGKGTFIARYSVKLRYCASGPPGLIEIIFDINNGEAFVARHNSRLHVIAITPSI